MIDYNYLIEVIDINEIDFTDWLTRVIKSEKKELGAISFIFCSDEYLHSLNHKYLEHDTLTDIITFDYTEGNLLSGDIFVSVERVKENARVYEVTYIKELKRVMVHGVLHMMGYNDKSKEEMELMRKLEDEKIKMFHVEQ